MNYNDFELLDMIDENDEVAYSVMFNKYKAIIYSKACGYYNYLKKIDYSAISVDDFVAVGLEALDYAIKYFDPNKGYLFYSYFLVCLNSKFNLLLRSLLFKKNRPLLHYQEFDFEIEDSLALDPYDYVDYLSEKMKLQNYLYDLDFIDSAILELRLNDFKYKEISELLGVGSSKVSRVIKAFRERFGSR